MKTIINKNIITLMLMFVALPMMSQDYMNIHFKNGDFRKFYMKNVTEITTSKFDADGVQHGDYDYQHITTIHDKYVYSLEDVESITFTKIDEEIAEDNLLSVLSSLIPVISNCESIKDAERMVDVIKSIKGVNDAWSDGHQLFIKVDEWETFSFHFKHHDNQDANLLSSRVANENIKKFLPRLKTTVKPKDKRIHFGIANQTNFDENQSFEFDRNRYYHPLIATLNANNIDAKYIERPTLDFFYDNSDDPENDPHLYDLDAIILDTHGAYVSIYDNDLQREKMIHRFATGEELGSINESLYEWDILDLKRMSINSKLKKLREKYKDATDQHIYLSVLDETRNGKKYIVFYAGVTEKFFEQIATGHFLNPNSLFFNCACQSLKGYKSQTTYASNERVPSNYSLANIFIEKGLGTYVGFNQTVSISPETGCYLFLSMLNGKSIDKACYDLEDNQKMEFIKDENVTAYLMRVPDISDAENGKTFLIPTYTNTIDQAKLNEDYQNNQTVTLTGQTTSPGLDENLSGGFLYGENKENLTETAVSLETYQTLNLGKGNIVFSATLTGLQRGKIYYYRAYTYDGMNYNYGEICSFKIPEQPMDEKVVMLSQNVGDTTYEIYKINTDKEDYHINPDGWKCYKSALMLDMTKNGKTSTYTLDDNIYLDNSDNHHGGQRPCLYLSSNSDQLFVYINSKDSRNSYSMDGYAYRTSLSNVSFTKETVFTSRNWGWYPYFTYSDGVLSVQHFSFAGYYAMTSYRNSDGTWTTQQGNYIKPDAFNEQSEQAGNVLVDDNSGVGGDIIAYPSCPDNHHPHLIDLGLPSGTKWACCNVGSTKPEEYGGYYAWGETEEKSYYDWSTYIHCDGSYSTCQDLGSDISGTEYDVAHVKWGGNWRMPTTDEQRELLDNCTTEWMTLNGVNGRKFTSNINGNSIFLPAAGYLLFDSFGTASGVGGDYWSSKPSSMRKNSCNLRFDSTDISFGTYDRRDGKPVRPVYK